MIHLLLTFLAWVIGLSAVIAAGAFVLSKKQGFKGRCDDAGVAGVVALTALPCIVGPGLFIWNLIF